MTLEHFGRVISLFGPLDEDMCHDSDVPSPVSSRHGTPVSSPTNVGIMSGRAESPKPRSTSPLFKDSSKDKKSTRSRSRTIGSSRLFKDMADLRKEPWFVGAVATDKVQETLRTDRPGSYLVRYSNNPKAPSSFCLSRVTRNQHVRHHYIVQRVVDGTRQFGLHISKTEILFAKSLALLMRDPRIVETFSLIHPVNKVSSFSQQHVTRSSENVGGYLSHFEYEPSSDNDDELNPNVPVSMDLGTSPPSHVDLEHGPPRPRSPPRK